LSSKSDLDSPRSLLEDKVAGLEVLVFRAIEIWRAKSQS
jgi:hypothetical protein